jgi:hypothetical protein
MQEDYIEGQVMKKQAKEKIEKERNLNLPGDRKRSNLKMRPRSQ